jgi:hypothetical protein
MSNQFKAGDLALVFASAFPDNNGRQVELVQFVPHGSTISSIVSDQDFNNTSGRDIWCVVGDVGNPLLCLTRESFFEEKQLMPLRGDFQPERQQSREVQA